MVAGRPALRAAALMRDQLLAALVDAIPFASSDTFKIVEIGSGDGRLTEALLERFPHATIVALEGSESERFGLSVRLARFTERIDARPFTIDALGWWDVMVGAGLVVSLLQLHALNDAKRRYLFKAAAERLSDDGALVVGDRLQPQTLLHHLVWLKHAGFAAVDCYWMSAAHAVFGGIKRAGASEAPLRADN
jgi:tRNA (cmo5U34)-methyltransferase